MRWKGVYMSHQMVTTSAAKEHPVAINTLTFEFMYCNIRQMNSVLFITYNFQTGLSIVVIQPNWVVILVGNINLRG